jgi:type 1 glutamine amidotransferase
MVKMSQAASCRQRGRRAALIALAMTPLFSHALPAVEPADKAAAPVKVVVVTGGHGYDAPSFKKLFDALEGIQTTFQKMDEFVASPSDVRDGYHVVLFYHMLMPDPKEKTKEALEHLGGTQQGIVVLHHALLAYPQWPVWTDVMGIANRKFGYHMGQKLRVNVANAQHPITKGLESWEMTDETYTMADAGEGSEILLTADHPKSMKTIGWTREHKKSRVFCFESGHDNKTWSDPNFREVLRRGILWCARKL